MQVLLPNAAQSLPATEPFPLPGCRKRMFGGEGACGSYALLSRCITQSYPLTLAGNPLVYVT